LIVAHAVALAACGGGGGGHTPTFTIGCTITGPTGTVVLRNNGTDERVLSADGAFMFAAAVVSGSAYDVKVVTQPSYPAQDCVVANGSGTAGSAMPFVQFMPWTLSVAPLAMRPTIARALSPALFAYGVTVIVRVGSIAGAQ
jgi:hypothetical protein